jgi:hypothetical protein
MSKHYLLGGMLVAAMVGGLGACAADDASPLAPTSTEPAAQGALVTGEALTGVIRLRCERRSNRSKISVDGRSLSPRTGRFRARVRAAGGTATTGLQRAVAGEAEFDFDSNRADIQAGATAIPVTFVRARSGPDVIAEILNAQGTVVARQGGECAFR